MPLRLWRAQWSVPARRLVLALACPIVVLPLSARGQDSAAISMSDALIAARRYSPELLAARDAVASARGRERQAAAYANPAVGYSREQTSGGGQSNAQHIAVVQQPLELGGIRAARRDAATSRRVAAEWRLAAAETQLDFEVRRSYAVALSADRRAELATEAADAFAAAVRISTSRLIAGDISGYAARRVKLEAARYAAMRAEAQLARRSARLTLAALTAPDGESIGRLPRVRLSAVPMAPLAIQLDSLLSLAQARAELRALLADADAALADARLTSGERVPSPIISAGVKTERVRTSSTSGAQSLRGFTAGVSIPLPLWDRRAGAIEAADAEARRRTAETDALRRRIVREVAEALDAFRSAEDQLAALAPQLGTEARAALRAAQVAYSEGEITLVEWLDTVRAYREAEASFATLQADALVQRAALERAVGIPFVPGVGTSVVPSPRQENR